MAILTDWTLRLDVDHVLRGQGSDPAVIRSRRPALVQVAERALAEATPLLAPVVAYTRLEVRGLRHERLDLDGRHSLQGRLIAEHLSQAEEVVVMVCTIGGALDELVGRAMVDDPVYGLALDGVGSAAAEALAGAACRRFEEEAAVQGRQATIPLSPGMVGWPVAEGQAQLFSIIDPVEAGVMLTDSGMMVPRKSLSQVLGLGANIQAGGSACAFCSLNETCRYQDHYPPARSAGLD